MLVCYGFGCRRRLMLDFTDTDRKRLTEILASGRASPEAERKAVQQAVVWFDRRVGPIIGTSKRVARADFRNFADASTSIVSIPPAMPRAFCSFYKSGA